MEVKSQGKFLRVSPRKVRNIAREIKGKNAIEAMALLGFLPQKGARVMEKVLKSAIANAENNFNLKKEALTVSEAFVDEGPRYKRYQPRARGAAYPILKRTSHITIIVSGEEYIRKIRKTEEHEKKIETEKPEAKGETGFKEMAKEKEKGLVTNKRDKKGPSLKDLARDRKEKESRSGIKEGGKEKKKIEKKIKEDHKGGFWSRFFRRKTG